MITGKNSNSHNGIDPPLEPEELDGAETVGLEIKSFAVLFAR